MFPEEEFNRFLDRLDTLLELIKDNNKEQVASNREFLAALKKMPADQKSSAIKDSYTQQQQQQDQRREVAVSRLERELSSSKDAIAFMNKNLNTAGQSVLIFTDKISTTTDSLSSFTDAIGSLPIISGSLVFAFGRLVSQGIDNAINAFSEVAKSGLNYSGSIMSFSMMATEAGVGMDQFGRIVKENSRSIGQIGVESFANIARNARLAGDNLYALGLTTEEITQFTADYLDMSRYRGTLESMDQNTLHLRMQNMTEQMYAFSDATGVAVDEIMKVAKQASSDTDLQAMLSGRTQEEYDRIMANLGAFSGFSSQAQEIFKDIIATGGVTEESFLMLQAIAPDAADALRDAANGFIDTTTFQKRYSEAVKNIPDEMLKQLGTHAKLGDQALSLLNEMAIKGRVTIQTRTDEDQAFADEVARLKKGLTNLVTSIRTDFIESLSPLMDYLFTSTGELTDKGKVLAESVGKAASMLGKMIQGLVNFSENIDELFGEGWGFPTVIAGALSALILAPAVVTAVAAKLATSFAGLFTGASRRAGVGGAAMGDGSARPTSRLGRAARGARTGGAVGVAVGGLQALQGEVGAGVGSAAGAVVGGIVGSLAGPAGTMIGATIGSWLGSLTGEYIEANRPEPPDNLNRSIEEVQESYNKLINSNEKSMRAVTARINDLNAMEERLGALNSDQEAERASHLAKLEELKAENDSLVDRHALAMEFYSKRTRILSEIEDALASNNTELASQLESELQTVNQQINENYAGTPELFGNAFSRFFSHVGRWALNLFGFRQSPSLQDVAETLIPSFFKGIPQLLSAPFNLFFSQLDSLFSVDFVSSISDTVSGVFGTFSDFSNNFTSTIMDSVSGVFDQLGTIGSNASSILNDIVDSTTSGVSSFVNDVSSTFDNAINFVSNKLASPRAPDTSLSVREQEKLNIDLREQNMLLNDIKGILITIQQNSTTEISKSDRLYDLVRRFESLNISTLEDIKQASEGLLRLRNQL